MLKNHVGEMGKLTPRVIAGSTKASLVATVNIYYFSKSYLLGAVVRIIL